MLMHRVLGSLCHCWLIELSLRRLLETFSGVSTPRSVRVVIPVTSHGASRPSCVVRSTVWLPVLWATVAGFVSVPGWPV
jgi:hypothetical protein